MSNTLQRPRLQAIETPEVRQALQWLYDYLDKSQVLGADFKLFDMNFTRAETNLKIPHGFDFIPMDIIQTFLTGSGVVTYNHELFDGTNIVLSTSGPCRARFLAGKLK